MRGLPARGGRCGRAGSREAASCGDGGRISPTVSRAADVRRFETGSSFAIPHNPTHSLVRKDSDSLEDQLRRFRDRPIQANQAAVNSGF